MKNLFITSAIALIFATGASAQDQKFRFGLGVSTLGGTLEGAYRFNDTWAIRGVLSGGLNANGTQTVSGVTYNTTGQLGGFALLGDYYTGNTGFRVSGGAFVSNTSFAGSTTASLANPITIGNTTLTGGQTASATVAFQRKVSPMATIGYDWNVGRRFTISGEVGAIAMGGLNVTLTAPAAPAADAAPAAASKDIANAPSAEKAMAEAGLSAANVAGTGRDGRIMKDDVARAMAAAAAAPAPAAAAAPTPRAPVAADDASREERVKMTRLRQTIAKRLKESQNTAAMLTTYNEVDMGEVMALRNQYKDQFEKKHGVRLGFMSFFTKACCHALKEVPEVNAEIDGTDVVYKNFVHMGVAAGTPTGLVVPVIRDADAMSFAEIEKAISEKGKRARDGKLTMAEMQGGTFTLSNGGVYGSLMSSPILNPPQSGILGMHKIQDRPMAINGEVVIRPMMYLALSYDHRIVDGKGAVTFLVRVKEALEDPRRLLMDL